MNFNFKAADEPHEKLAGFILGTGLTMGFSGLMYGGASQFINAFNKNGYGNLKINPQTFDKALQKMVSDGHATVNNGKITITEAGKAAARDVDKVMGIGDGERLGPFKNGKPVNQPGTAFNQVNPSAGRLNQIIAKGKNAAPAAPSVPAPMSPPVVATKPNLFGNFKMVPQMSGGVMRMVKVALKPLAAVGLAYDAYDNATGLVSSLQRGEGFASIPRHIQNAFSGEPEAQDVVQPPKGGLSNIPPSEGSINNPAYGTQPSTSVSSQNEPAESTVTNDPGLRRSSAQLIQPRRKAQSYSPELDPRNAEYLAARDALGPNPSAADIKAVEDIGMATWESIYGKQ